MKYQDILFASRPASPYPPMPLENRAKLFSPFAALRGFDIRIITEAKDRTLFPKIPLSQDREEEICRMLQQLQPGDPLSLTWFVPKKQIQRQTLGVYRCETGLLQKISLEKGFLTFSGHTISFADIHEIQESS